MVGMAFQNLLQRDTEPMEEGLDKSDEKKAKITRSLWSLFEIISEGKGCSKWLIFSFPFHFCCAGIAKIFFAKKPFPSTHSICLQSCPCSIYNSDPLSPFSLFLLFMNRDPEKTDIIWLHKYPLALAEINIHTGYIRIGCTTQMITKGDNHTIWINQTLGILYNFSPSHPNEQSMARIRTQTTSCMSCVRTSYK